MSVAGRNVFEFVHMFMVKCFIKAQKALFTFWVIFWNRCNMKIKPTYYCHDYLTVFPKKCLCRPGLGDGNYHRLESQSRDKLGKSNCPY